jgi:tetratricopeptide (TPR) repeat protein
MRRNILSAVILIWLGVPVNCLSATLQISNMTPSTGVTTPGLRVLISGDHFSPDTKVYFSGLQGRQMNFIDSSRLEVVTPYLRPGEHRVYLKSLDETLETQFIFTSISSNIDSDVDKALDLKSRGDEQGALRLLQDIIDSTEDLQVRSFAYYQKGKICYEIGDFLHWRWEIDAIYLDGSKPEMDSVQTNWEYSLAFALAHYYIARPVKDEAWELRPFDKGIRLDVTKNPELPFYRSLVCARIKNYTQAKADIESCLKLDVKNPLYMSLAAYISAVSGDSKQALSLCTAAYSLADKATPINRARSLCIMGETFFRMNQKEKAQEVWTLAASDNPFGADLALLAAKKHILRGEQEVGAMLLSECISLSPTSRAADEARTLLTP